MVSDGRIIQKIVHLSVKHTLLLSFISAAILGIIFNVFKLSSFKVLVHEQQWNQAWNMLEFGGWLLFSLTTMIVWTSIFFIMLYLLCCAFAALPTRRIPSMYHRLGPVLASVTRLVKELRGPNSCMIGGV